MNDITINMVDIYGMRH